MAQKCSDLTQAQCDWIIANRPNVPCQRYNGLLTKCRKRGGARKKMTPADIAAFEAAQTAVPSGGMMETMGGVVRGAAAIVTAPVVAVGQALAGPPAPAPIDASDLLTLSPFQISEITGMSVGRIRQLRASRFGDRPPRVSKKRHVSKRKSKRRVSKRKSKRRVSKRKSKRRVSRRRSKRRSSR